MVAADGWLRAQQRIALHFEKYINTAQYRYTLYKELVDLPVGRRISGDNLDEPSGTTLHVYVICRYTYV